MDDREKKGPAAELDEVVVEFRGVKALDGCSMVLEAGKVHGLVGPGGSGKTLVVKCLATLVEPDAGVVSVFGSRVDHGDRETLRKTRSRIGIQFQNLALFDFLSVFDNVAFPLVMSGDSIPADELAARVEDALSAVGLSGTGHLGLSELSGGMQRRVALARASIVDADLLLYDDPTGGLDPVTSSRIFALVREIHERRGATVVVASHDVDRLARICDLFHVVDHGRVLFSGTLEQGLASELQTVRTFMDVEGMPA